MLKNLKKTKQILLKNRSTYKRLDESLEKVVQENQRGNKDVFKSRNENQEETLERLRESLDKVMQENKQIKEQNKILKQNNETILKLCSFYIEERKFKKKAHKKKETKIANVRKSVRKQTGETVKEDETQNEWIDVVKKRQKNHPKNPEINPETKKKEVTQTPIFCHFFNNDKECHYKKKCKFLHQQSPQCRRKASCTRKNCMYRHNSTEDKTKNDNKPDENEKLQENSSENKVKTSSGEKSSNQKLEEKSYGEIWTEMDKSLEDETSSSEDPPEDEDSLEYREKMSQRLHDIFFS